MTNKEKEQKGFKCCICGQRTIGWGNDGQFGNNPAPVKDKGECCDKCNSNVVIPARFGGIKVNYIFFASVTSEVEKIGGAE